MTLKRAAIACANRVLGATPTVRRVPFGPIRGRRVCNAPTISLRMLLGIDEPWVTATIRREVRPGMVAYDIGAHIGYTALVLAQAGAEVHAFELHPATTDLLRRTLAANPDLTIRAHPVGVGREAATVVLALGATCMSSLYARRTVTEPVPCRVVALDAYIAETGIRAPDFIKMDIEHAEVAALGGARETLRRRPRLLIEFHSRRLLNDGTSLLREHGYRRFTCADPLSLEGDGRFHASVLCH
jgi:FkbM family methyltransferase